MATRFESQTFARLIDSGALQIGDGHRAKLSELGGDGPIFLRAGLVSDEGIQLQGADRFREDVVLPSSKLTRARDTFVTTKGNSIGRTGYVPGELPQLVYSPHLSYWRSLDEDTLHPEYLRYWARSPDFVSQLHAMAHGTDMAPYLSLIDQKRLVIPLPPIHEQRSIADVLGAIDDKIDSNRRLGAVLEETAATLFRALYLDFVGIEDFEETGIGLIPRGWLVKRVEELATVNARSHTARVHPDRIHYIDISSVGARHVRDVKDLAFSEAPSRARRVVRSGDTIVSTVRPERRAMAFIHAAPAGLTASTGFAVLTPGPAAATYVYRLVTSDRCIDFLAAAATGSAYPAVHPSVLALWAAPVPPDLGESYERVARPLEGHRHALFAETKTLVELRDTLLPPLISGRMRVPEATSVDKLSVAALQPVAAS
jgi:type I restriction enzyme S subunit